MLRALISAPESALSVSVYEESGVTKFLERWSRMGARRSSSSNLGRARAVSWKLRCALLALSLKHQVVVVIGGEGAVNISVDKN